MANEEIPDLKKKEKDRKKGGAFWRGAKSGGDAFSGATGGAARSAASAGAAVGTDLGGASLLGRLTATALGKTILAAGAALMVGGAGLIGYGLFKGEKPGYSSLGTGELGAMPSALKVRPGGKDRTGFVAGKGEIAFEEPVKPSQPAEEAAPEPAAENAPPAEAKKEEAFEKRPDWWGGGLAHNLSGSKLSASLGDGKFAGKNIFGGGGAPQLTQGVGSANLPIASAQKGKIAPLRHGATGRLTRGIGRTQANAKRAFGQLKIAKGLSAVGAGSRINEDARSTAGDAFERQAGQGNIADGPSAPPSGTPNVSGPGAPDMTAPGVDTPAGTPNMGDNFQAINGIASMAKSAGQMKKNGMMLLAVGAVLVAVGIGLLAFGFTAAIGAALIALGAALIGMGFVMLQQGEMMKNMADALSESLAARTTDANQNNINHYCIEEAYQNGTNPDACTPPDSVTHGSGFDASNAPAVERHRNMVEETGHVELGTGSPTP